MDRTRAFFAHTVEIEQLAELLRSTVEHAEDAKNAALLVVGPSGCGKSSLLRAGLLPVMTGEPGWWTLSPIMPGADPVGALARELATALRELDLDWTVEHIRHELDEVEGLVRLADHVLIAARVRCLLVVVDQFEELLTQAEFTDRTRFVELLRVALTGPVRVVGALRPEFLDQLLSDPAFATLSTNIFSLRPLRPDGLRQVIEKPAQLAGIAVDERLVAQLVNDTENGNALRCSYRRAQCWDCGSEAFLEFLDTRASGVGS